MESREVTDMVHIPCPACGKLCKRAGTAAAVNHSTLDCEHCGILLVIKDGRVYPFHEWMHSQDPRWPVDGTDTAYVEV